VKSNKFKNRGQTSSKNNLNLTIIELLNEGKNQKDVCSILGRSKSNVAYHFSKLKAQGVIEQIAYGTWKVSQNKFKTSSKTKVGDPLTFSPTSSKIRGHGFKFRVQIPKLHNWSRREVYLQKKNISYSLINKGFTHKIIVKGHIVWLSSSSVVVYFKKNFSILADSARGAEERAFYELMSVMKSLESMFKCSFRIGKSFKVRLFGSHHALMNNGLAKEYNHNKEKLRVFSKDGLWLLIDDSFGFDELECVHPTTARADMDGVVNMFFNSLKEAPFSAYDFKKTFHLMEKQAEQNDLYAENIRSHLSAIQELRDSMKDIKKLVKFAVDK